MHLSFDGVDLLDFAGPHQVFNLAAQPPLSATLPPSPIGEPQHTPPPGVPRMTFDVAILGEHHRIRTSHGRGCEITRDIDIFSGDGQDDKWDVVVVPGGAGIHMQLGNLFLVDWISRFARSRNQRGRRKTILSVCTGTLLLAKATILDGMEVTTHASERELLQKMIAEGGGQVVDRKVVAQVLRNGTGDDLGVDVITSAGISSGIDGALYVVKKIAGEECARGTAAWMEYDWHDDV